MTKGREIVHKHMERAGVIACWELLADAIDCAIVEARQPRSRENQETLEALRECFEALKRHNLDEASVTAALGARNAIRKAEEKP